ncbi:MAG TPA: chemotaxis protein CheB [Candidatus Thermoplasmatota archaeon]|jgi:two-component system CheB/CheR fusion protein|nr:chemotaxis protein CheB [Candidatus Thermoplasmatota archaeon]
MPAPATPQPAPAAAQQATSTNTAGGKAAPPCPIVGIGASAGWFEAFSELLRALPQDTGMAYVFVTHLDPKHESQMAQVLERMTPMSVVEVKDGMAIEPDHVYVIPAHALLVVEGERLRLQPREDAPPQAHAIDGFFRSLANARGDQSVGVILSGTLSDGTQGLKDIRAAGGFTFAQSPESATYREMPWNAIAAGHVDFVLTPAEIAADLARLRERMGRREARDDPPEPVDGRELADLLKLLRNRVGVDFSQYKRSTLMRRIERRVLAHGCETLAQYIKVVQTDRDEARALYEEILIHVTRFFREEPSYQALVEHVLPGLVEDRPNDRPLRVWVPGCATGEEAYSLAITILEFLERHGSSLPLQVFATDVSEKAIKTARDGLYADSIADDVSNERLLRYFEKTDGGYRISKAVRGMCVFALHDVTADPPFSSMDVVSFRNVLVYMEAELQRHVLATLHYALRPNGYLVLGTAESVGRSDDLFAPLDKDRRVYVKRNTGLALAPRFLRQAQGADALSGRVDASPARAAFDPQREADRMLLERFVPAGVVVDGDLKVVQFRGETSPFLEHQPGPASLDLLRMATGGLGLDLRALVQDANARGGPVRRRHVRAAADGKPKTTILEATPIQGPTVVDRFYLILFLDEEPRGAAVARVRPARGWLRPWQARGAAADRHARVAALERELAAAHAYLQSNVEDHEATMEELRSANEESVSSNEELQSTNEELETAKEELQSTNEELTTLNEELQERNADVQRANNDLMNLLNSITLPIVMVGPDLRIRRFTPRAQQLLNLIPTDLGRPLSDIRHPFGALDLRKDLLDVIASFQPRQLDVHDEDGAQHAIRILPYRTTDNRVDGAVVLFLTGPEERPAAAVAGALEAALTLAETVWDPVVVLDDQFRVKAANRQFYAQFELTRDAAIGRPLFELSAFWKAPAVRDLLEKVLPERGEVLDHVLPDAAGGGTAFVNARSLRPYGEGPPLIVLAFRATP